MKLSVVIPVYNEAKTVAALIEKVRAVQLDKEIIIVDDGSSDGTAAALEPYRSVPGVRIGFSYVSGDIVVIQDADLELDPEEYHHLIRRVGSSMCIQALAPNLRPLPDDPPGDRSGQYASR